jgi:hypothetical protein
MAHNFLHDFARAERVMSHDERNKLWAKYLAELRSADEIAARSA